MHGSKWFVLLCTIFLGVLFFAPASRAQIDDATRKLSHDIFKQLIEINSTDSAGQRDGGCGSDGATLSRCGICRGGHADPRSQ